MFEKKRIKTRKSKTTLYTSSLSEFVKWMRHHPIKFVEYYTRTQLKWYQKLILLIDYYASKIKKRKVEKVLKCHFK